MKSLSIAAIIVAVSTSAFAVQTPRTFDHGGLDGRPAVVCDVYTDAACAAAAGTSAPDAVSRAIEAAAPNGSRVFNH